MNTSAPTAGSSLVHRGGVLLAALTFPLIWVGGLVTSTNAGMAVPDWPSTYGYNMFLYPWQSWFFGPWDLFVEHGHRLLGSLVGLVAMFVVGVACFVDRRRWVIAASAGLLLLVIGQGALGGMRVLLDERLLARLHGCVGPLFFALTVAFAVGTSPRRRVPVTAAEASPAEQRLFRYAATTLFVGYLQLIIGAHIRHISLDSSPQFFRTMVVFHLLAAVVVTVLAVNASTIAFLAPLQNSAPRFPAGLLACLVVLQIGLGVGAYVVRFAWPEWMSGFDFAARNTITAHSFSGALIRTGHAANGSAVLGAACWAAVSAYHSSYLPKWSPRIAGIRLTEVIA